MIYYAADYREMARDNLRGNWGLSIAVVFMATLLGGTMGGSSLSIEIPSGVQTLVEEYLTGLLPFVSVYAVAISGLGLAQLILGGAVALGNAQYHLDQYDRKPLSFKTLFSKFDQFGAGLCLTLLSALYCILWGSVPMVLGIILGFLVDYSEAYLALLCVASLIVFVIASYRYAIAFYLLAEYPEMRARDAIRASVELMRGRKWSLFCMNFSFIGWHFLAFLTLGIGNLFLGPYISAAYAAFYRQTKSPRQDQLPAPGMENEQISA